MRSKLRRHRRFEWAIHIYALPLRRNSEIAGTLALFTTQVTSTTGLRPLRDSLLTAFVQTVLITGFALILVQWTFTVPLTRTAKWLRILRTGQSNAAGAFEGRNSRRNHHEVTHCT